MAERSIYSCDACRLDAEGPLPAESALPADREALWADPCSTPRDEYLAGARVRALALVEAGWLVDAWGGFAWELQQHPETAGHPELERGIGLFLHGHLAEPEAVRRWLEEVL